jgi:Flp pilus assembly pilin Flp
MATMLSGLGSALHDAWESIRGGALGSTVWDFTQRRAAVVTSGLVAVGQYLVGRWDAGGQTTDEFLRLGAYHLNNACK